MKQIFLYSIFGLSVGAMVFFTMTFLSETNNIKQGQAFYENLSIEIIQNQFDEYSSSVTDKAKSLPKTKLDSEIFIIQDSNNGEFQTIEIESKEDEAPPIFKSFIDFDTMRGNYPDIVAWIKAENLNYPIVQGIDNNYYLSRLPNSKHHVMGSIFLDYRNLEDFSEQTIILYGHDSRKGDMFGSLKYYASQEYYEQNSSVLIFTPKCDYNLMLIAGYIIDSAFEVPPMNFIDPEDFEQYIADIKNRSIFKSKSDIEVNYGDQLVYLATCISSGSINDRLIIVGKLEIYV